MGKKGWEFMYIDSVCNSYKLYQPFPCFIRDQLLMSVIHEASPKYSLGQAIEDNTHCSQQREGF